MLTTLQWYIALIREVTDSQKKKLSLAEQAAAGNEKHETNLFGDIEKYINHDGKKLASMTLASVARVEWSAIEILLRQALTPAIEGRK